MTPRNDSVDEWIRERSPTDIAPSLSVVVPAYNEYRRLPLTLMDMIDFLDLKSQDGSGFSYEIIVVDDGSSDETAEIVQKFERIRRNVKLICVPKNYGKGHAVRLGMLNAHGKRVLFADADGATPFQEVDRLSAALDEGFDVAIGSRAVKSDTTKVKTLWYRKYLGRSFNFVVNVLVVPDIADTQCGFKMFTDRATQFLFKRQRSDGFSFDV